MHKNCVRGRVKIEYYSGNCVCCIEPRKALYELAGTKYKGMVEMVEKNLGEEPEVAYAALERGVTECSTFIIGDEKITDISTLEKRLEQILGFAHGRIK